MIIQRLWQPLCELIIASLRECGTGNRPGATLSYMRWPVSLASIVLSLHLVATLSWAGKVHDVASLLDNPGSYQSQVVHIKGTVYNHKIRRGANKCFQLFTIEDETGSIEAVYTANCSGASIALRDRDVVTVEARFELISGNTRMLKVQSIVSKFAPSAQ